jgi:hypothetical protein
LGLVLTIRHSASEQRGTTSTKGTAAIKGTKTDQSRRISLDAATVALLIDHRQQLITRCADLGVAFDERQFLFSYQPDHSQPCSPRGVTHRYARMVGRLGIRTHLHAIRHYSATELLASGVDLRTVAGRLGTAAAGLPLADPAVTELMPRTGAAEDNASGARRDAVSRGFGPHLRVMSETASEDLH